MSFINSRQILIIITKPCLFGRLSIFELPSNRYHELIFILGTQFNDSNNPSRTGVYSTTPVTPNSQLAKARIVLESGLKVISDGRANDVMNDGKNVADILWMSKAEQVSGVNAFSQNHYTMSLAYFVL